VPVHTAEVVGVGGGRVLEHAPTRTLFRAMRSPYTKALLAAIPRIDAPPHTVLAAIPGRPPDLARLPAGCAFAPRCAYASARCMAERPPLVAADGGAHAVACWNPTGTGEAV
jgi:peptide/nickel transport system ATP-binding protein